MTDWKATLSEQGDFAASLGKHVCEALVSPELTFEQAHSLDGVVGQGFQVFNHFVEQVQALEPDEHAAEVVKAIDDTWKRMLLATAKS